jgi:hypothetical protein
MVGITLLTIQGADKLLRLYLPRLLPKTQPKNLEDFLSKERPPRATLGQVITSLRRNGRVEAGFEIALVKFIRDRNMPSIRPRKFPAGTSIRRRGSRSPSRIVRSCTRRPATS